MANAALETIGAFSQLGMGKDTLCDYLVNKINKGRKKEWKRSAFASAVKKVFSESFEYDKTFIEEWKRKTDIPEGLKVTVRQALQKIGDGFREIKPDIWIDLALRGADKLIISDGRYLNEAKKIRQRNGVNVLIYRSGYLNQDTNLSEASLRPLLEHCSNIIPDGKIQHGTLVRYPDGLDDFDFFIRNDGDLESFYKKIDRLLVPYITSKL